jgi:eukaryotic-like serine/threonine-protein kinase
MSLGKYLTSRVFFAQILATIAIVALLTFLFFYWITFITNHGQEIVVPNVIRLNEEQAEQKLDDLGLEYQVIDTLDYNPDFPKLAIVQQEPTANSRVKAGRIVYIKINAASYKKVPIPDLIEKTYRQAVPTLKALGLQEGEITYVPYLGKDMVLKMLINGKEVKPGTKVLKATKIDLVLGDGEVVFDDTEVDSIVNEAQKIESQLEKDSILKNEQ